MVLFALIAIFALGVGTIPLPEVPNDKQQGNFRELPEPIPLHRDIKSNH